MELVLAVKIAAIIVHADELTSPEGNMDYDGPAIRSLVEDDEVIQWLETIDPAFLPLKRSTK